MVAKTKETQLKAAEKYLSKFESLTIRCKPGTKSRIEKLGYKSVNAFVVAAIMEKIEREEGYRKGD